MKSVFMIPVYNQEQQLPGFLEQLREASSSCDNYLLVNDGSTDDSQAVIRQSGIPYLDYETNRGVGHSMIRAIEWALEEGFDVLGTMASNGKMLPSEIPRLLAPLASDADYTKGSRFLPGGEHQHLRLFRRMAIPMVNQYVRFVTGQSVTDSTCGFRAYHLDVIRRANFDWRAPWLYRYAFEYYLDAKVLIDPILRFTEVPVSMNYPKAGRCSKIRPGIDWYAMLKPWIVARFDGGAFEPLARRTGSGVRCRT